MTGKGKNQKLEGLGRKGEERHCLWAVRPRGEPRGADSLFGRTEDTFLRFLGVTSTVRASPWVSSGQQGTGACGESRCPCLKHMGEEAGKHSRAEDWILSTCHFLPPDSRSTPF